MQFILDNLKFGVSATAVLNQVCKMIKIVKKRGQSHFLGYGDISQSSVCMNQEIEIKHLEASDLPV